MTQAEPYVTETDRVEVFQAVADLSRKLPAPEWVRFHSGNWISIEFATASEVIAWARELGAQKEWVRIHHGADSQTYFTGTWLRSHVSLSCIEKGHLDPAEVETVVEPSGHVPTRRVNEILFELNKLTSDGDNWWDWIADVPEFDREATHAATDSGELHLVDGTVLIWHEYAKSWTVAGGSR